MLTLTGKSLGFESEIVNGPNGAFESTTVTMLSGKGTSSDVQRVRVGRDFPKSDLPREGEDCTLTVVVSAYSTRNGAGYRLTALERVRTTGARISSAPAAASA